MCTYKKAIKKKKKWPEIGATRRRRMEMAYKLLTEFFNLLLFYFFATNLLQYLLLI